MPRDGMATVHTLLVPRSQANTYVVVGPDPRHGIILDPGNEQTEPILSLVSELGLTVPYLILTHEHFDHVAGANQLRERLGSQIVCSAACAERVTCPRRNMSRYSGLGDVTAGPADLTCEQLGWQLNWAGASVRLIATPGHTPSSICLAFDDCLFTGDTLLNETRTPTNLPEGDAEALKQSVQTLIREFAPETLVYPGHGEPFRLSRVRLEIVLGRASACLHTT